MEAKREYFYWDDFGHRLLAGHLMTARNEYLHKVKSMENIDNQSRKIFDALPEKLQKIIDVKA